MIHSIVLISDKESFFKQNEDIQYLFQTTEIKKKNLLIYSPEPLSDISEIKKMPVDEIILLYRKDFIFNFALKTSINQTINKSSYTFLIHYNNNIKTLKKTILISQSIKTGIKITNLTDFTEKIKDFSIAIKEDKNFFKRCYELILKTNN